MIQLIKEYREFKQFREKVRESDGMDMAAIAQIRDTEGFRVIIKRLQNGADNVKDVTFLSAHYGNKNINEKIGPLGGAGIIAAHILEAIISSFEEV